MSKASMSTIIPELDNAKIRRTPDGLASVFDLIAAIDSRKDPYKVWERLLERYPEVSTKCRNFKFSGRGQRETHALSFIKRWDSPHTVIYADPPYPNTVQGHYDGYTLDDYQALCDALDACESSYVLSNYHQDIAPKSAQKCIEIEATMSASNGRSRVAHDTKRIEKLWICDRSKNIRADLKAIAKMPTKHIQQELWNC